MGRRKVEEVGILVDSPIPSIMGDLVIMTLLVLVPALVVLAIVPAIARVVLTEEILAVVAVVVLAMALPVISTGPKCVRALVSTPPNLSVSDTNGVDNTAVAVPIWIPKLPPSEVLKSVVAAIWLVRDSGPATKLADKAGGGKDKELVGKPIFEDKMS